LTGEAHRVRTARRAGSGHANTTWLLESDPADLVIKAQLTPSVVFDRRPELEPMVLELLHGSAVPVPRLVASDVEEELLGAPWFAMQWIAGGGVPDDSITGYAAEGWFASTTPDRRMKLWERFIDRLADLHSLPASTFDRLGRGGSHGEVLDYWDASLAEVLPAGTAPLQAAALQWLRANVPAESDDVRPCMGDARLANVIVVDSEVAALVDWELAHIGNPRADIAYHLFRDRQFAVAAGTRLSGLPTAQDTWRRWEEGTGLHRGDTRYWEVFAALIISITASRAMRLTFGLGAADTEALNPFAVELHRLNGDVAGDGSEREAHR